MIGHKLFFLVLAAGAVFPLGSQALSAEPSVDMGVWAKLRLNLTDRESALFAKIYRERELGNARRLESAYLLRAQKSNPEIPADAYPVSTTFLFRGDYPEVAMLGPIASTARTTVPGRLEYTISAHRFRSNAGISATVATTIISDPMVQRGAAEVWQMREDFVFVDGEWMVGDPPRPTDER